MKKKFLIPIMILILVIGAVGGTLAWLTDQTDTVQNTFTVGNVDIDLTEEGATEDSSDSQLFTQDFKMVPGTDIAKKPKVSVIAGSEACWLFVKVVESDNLDDYITYNMATEWTELTGVSGVSGVYYIDVNAATANAGHTYNVLAPKGTTGAYSDGYVTVNNTVTKAMMDALKVEGATQPTLTFKAYAVQKEGFDTAADAWVEASK